MRIIVLTTNFPSPEQPHRGVFLEQDALGLAARGHEVHCLVARSRLRDRGRYAGKAAGLRVDEARYLSLSYVRGFEYWFGALAQRNSTRALNRLLAGARPADIVYAKFLNTAPLLPFVSAGTARVLGIGEGIDSIRDRLAFFRPGHFERCVREADVLEVKNDAVAEWLGHEFPDLRARVLVVPSGVDTAFFCPGDRAQARQALGIEPGATVVAFVGARTPNKGGERLIAACAEASAPIRILMIGPGWSDASLPASVTGLGLVGRADVRTALQAADLFALPSVSEGMPNAVLEAMACELPCLVADRPYSAFLRHEVDCLKVDPLSVEEIRAAVQRLAGPAELRLELGRAARRTACGYSQVERVRAVERGLELACRQRGVRP